ncbi:gliding motility-associated C-terminal domain-containing protein [Pontibacter sp. Tf4]|uniref:gliding motility-associated C-terminal domain-containing protein n=1 Tax=Pontibacter sp. Tf4 TaxID=2761620 RepID=UPI00162ADFF5|nr:gliding motility-associated C-terminal domain-containing protein [Pontibacter sp. Tf4]MBB6610057.1 gliding motility-associated C-terminal domain-containing protein [Pontibacter sp. Tf4]
MKHRLLILILVMLSATIAQATHIVGGEFELRYVRANNYQLYLNLYFDDVNGNPGAFDQSITVNIFEKGTNRWIMSRAMSAQSRVPVPYTNIECTVSQLRTSKIVYNVPITLEPEIFNNPDGYYVTWERCCRNYTINNIQSPDAAAQTFYMEFPAVRQNNAEFRNSSPRLFPPLSDYACVNELFYFDFSGTDADGDSLVYDMVTPLNGFTTPAMPAYGVLGYEQVQPRPAPYPLVRWQPGYNTQNQIRGNPPMQIDAVTGRLTMRPEKKGLFVFGVRVQEFRMGKKIGEVRRDFQVMVLDCPTNASPGVLVREKGKKATYQENEVLRINPTGSRCLDVFFTDPDRNEFVALKVIPVNFPANAFTFSGQQQGIINRSTTASDTLKATICFDECFTTNGSIYKLDLVVQDDGCSLPRQDTVRLSFIAEPIPDALPTIALSTPLRKFNVALGDVLNFDVLGADADGQVVSVSARGVGFDLASQNISFTGGSGTGTVQSAFSWPIDCKALSAESYTIEFTVTSVFCGTNITRTEAIEVRPANVNHVPTIAATPADRIIMLQAGQEFEMDVLGKDIDGHALALTAAGTDFDLTATGMQFTSTNGNGSATGKLRWTPFCSNQNETVRKVTFTLKESTCNPSPDQTLTIEFRISAPNNAPTLTADKAATLYELELNEPFEVNFTGDDVDLNPLLLQAAGDGFDLQDYGMEFTATPGNGKATGTFKLTATCPMADRNVLRVNFILTEEACNPAPAPVLTMEFKVRVPLLQDFIPANIFTPNNDGLNDYFQIPDLPSDFCSARFASIKIFNRWGQEVYFSNQNTFKWDGAGANAGVYFYVIDFGNTQYKGSLTLVR